MKKKVIVVVFALFISIISYAQPVAGYLLFGGQVGFGVSSEKTKVGSTTTQGDKTTSFSFIPMVGYFLTDNIAVGLRTGYASSVKKYNNITYTRNTYSTFYAGPFARYYIIPMDNAGLFFNAGVDLGFGTYKYKVTINNSTTTTTSNTTSFDIGISPGIVIFVTERIGVEATFGWFGFSQDITKSDDTKYFYSNFEFIIPSFSFGITKML